MSLLEHMRLGTTGLRGYQKKLDVIGNNIANIGTTGFKKSNVSFAESWNYVTGNSIETEGGTSVLGPTSRGYGLSKPIIDVDNSQGQYQETGNPLDLAIQGDGFFVTENNGKQLYTRDGNFRLNKNLVLVQESSGAFIKGWTATFNKDGTSTIDTETDSTRMSFQLIQSIDAKPTTKIDFQSNLDAGSPSRKVVLDQSTFIITDDNQNKLNVTAKWTQIDKDTWNFSVKQDNIEKFSTQIDINQFGDLGDFALASEENLEIRRNNKNEVTHISWLYPSTTFDGKTQQKTMTIEFPKKTTQKDNSSFFAHTLRNANPDDENYLTSGSGVFQGIFTKGEKHVASSQVVDSSGFPHSLSTIFEHVNPQINQWEYKIKLPPSDPLVLAYLKDPDNKIVNPELPTEREVEAANDFIFGKSRTGLFQFNSTGFIGNNPSTIPKIISAKPETKAVILGTANIESVDKSFVAEMSTRFQKQGNNFVYQMLLDANSINIQSLALDPENKIIDPQNISETELLFLNDKIFKGTNTGVLKYKENGDLDVLASDIPKIVGTLSQGEINSELPTSIFNNGPDKLPEDELKNVGFLNIDLNVDLISGFGAPFSTRIEFQDGYVAGRLRGSSITSNGDGTIVGVFTNDQERDLGQLALAVFPNASILKSLGGNQFALSENSGFDENSIGKPNSATHGLVLSNYLELSNVNLAQEFTDLIIAQRSYSLSSKIVSTADQLLQVGIGLKR